MNRQPRNPESTSPPRRPSQRSTRSDVEDISIPERPWDEVFRRVDRLWVPDQAPHHSVVGQNGSGKSYLVTRGLLPLVRLDRVLIIDNKGDDPTLRGYGRPVQSIPKLRGLSSERKPQEDWFRLVVSDDWSQARDQVANALTRVYAEGGWTVVVDEVRAVSDPRRPGLGLQPLLDQMWLRGRSRGICVIGCTQAPRWVPSSFYDQCQFVWVSRIRDERAHQRVMEIGSMTRAHIPVIAGIRKRKWLYMDDEEDETWAAMTGL